MAELSQATIGGPQQVAISPVEPANTSSGIGEGLALLGQFIAGTQQGMQQRQAAKVEEQNNRLSGMYATELTKIADAVDQGTISSAEGRSRARSAFKTFLRDNPQSFDVLADTQKQFLSVSGMGQIISDGSEQEQQRIQFENSAVQAGWVKPNMGPQQREEAIASYREFLVTQDKIQAESQAIGLETARINQDTAGFNRKTAELNMQTKVAEKRSRDALANLSSSYSVKFRGDLNDVLGQLESGVVDSNTAIAQLDQQWGTIQAVVNSIGLDAGSDYRSALVQPMRTMYESAKQRATGEIDATTYENQVKKLINQQKLIMLQSEPELATLVATSEMIRGADMFLLPQVGEYTLRVLDRNKPNADGSTKKPADLTTSDPKEAKDVKAYLDLLKQNVSSTEPAAQAELQGHLNNVLRGIDAYSSSSESPEDYNQLVSFLASQEFGDAARNGTLGVDKSLATNASNVLEQQYTQVVVPLLQEEYESSRLLTGISHSRPGTPVPTYTDAVDVIQPTFSGGGVSFRVQGTTDSAVRNKAKELNQKVAPILNRLIRMSAHLNGTSYEQEYNTNFVGIFGTDNPEGEQSPQQ
jgi:hypothetical protein